jgi:hypothetical protein
MGLEGEFNRRDAEIFRREAQSFILPILHAESLRLCG